MTEFVDERNFARRSYTADILSASEELVNTIKAL
jgi:hypothetical protein